MEEKNVNGQKKKFDLSYWIILNIGILLLAAGVYFFKAPNNFASGGVSGLSIIIASFTSDIPYLGQTELMLYINSLMLIIGFIFLGRGCTFKTVYCSLVYSIEMQLMKFIPITLPMTDQALLEFVYDMLLTGIGSAIIFNCHASSGGTDIVALIVKKYTKLNVGTSLFIVDCLIAASTFFIFGIETGLYSMLGLFTKSFLIDGVIESIGKSKYLTVITAHPDKIKPIILQGFHRGYTSFKGVGGFTGEERTVMICVCKRNEAIKLKTLIKEADRSSFVIITDAKEIFGKGFSEPL